MDEPTSSTVQCYWSALILINIKCLPFSNITSFSKTTASVREEEEEEEGETVLAKILFAVHCILINILRNGYPCHFVFQFFYSLLLKVVVEEEETFIINCVTCGLSKVKRKKKIFHPFYFHLMQYFGTIKIGYLIENTVRSYINCLWTMRNNICRAIWWKKEWNNIINLTKLPSIREK